MKIIENDKIIEVTEYKAVISSIQTQAKIDAYSGLISELGNEIKGQQATIDSYIIEKEKLAKELLEIVELERQIKPTTED